MPYLEFKGRKFVENYHHTVAHHAFEFDLKLSVLPSDERPSLDGNLLIEGDNLKAMKALLPTHAGKIKCIYMDPPYNTGNEEWVYNDNLTQPQFKEWIGKTVGNEAEDATRHDKWCCMMMPRLAVAKELLSKDGVIFVSIDENEVHHLRLLMDDVFEPNNFRNAIAVKRGVKNVQSQFEEVERLSVGHEYILLYSANRGFKLSKLNKKNSETFNGKWDTFWRGTDRPTMRYQVFGQLPESGQWRWEESRAITAIENYRNYESNFAAEVTLDDYYLHHLHSNNEKLDFLRLNIQPNGSQVVQYYVAPKDTKLLSDNWMDLTLSGKNEDFQNSKNPLLLQRLIAWMTDEDDIILDCTAGSGTTAHAVLQLNAENDGKRRFILTQQKHDSKDDERKNINICQDITRERIKRVIEGTNTPELGGSFSYARLNETPVLGVHRDLDPLPSYEELARMVFYTHTSRAADEAQWNRESGFLGEHNGEAIFLLYDPHADIELGLERAWLEAWGRKDPRFHLVVYSEKFSMHRDDLREWSERHGKTVKHLLVPYEIK